MPKDLEKQETQEKVEKKVETPEKETEQKVEKPTETEQAEAPKQEAPKDEAKGDAPSKEIPENKEAEAEGDKKDDQPVVEDETQTYNAIRVEDLVTKDMLTASIDALNAKLEALAKENADLLKQNAELKDGKEKAEAETENMKDKYERGNFGTQSSKNYGGNEPKAKGEYQSFDEYSKQFM